jgi:transcriptional regulator with XRE-family HTH domain
MSVQQRIKEARAKRKMTYQQFGDAVGVTRGAAQQWETGATEVFCCPKTLGLTLSFAYFTTICKFFLRC